MDRSFLLQKNVVGASRDFVCIRLATYEDKEEVEYLTQVFRGGSGTLENTVFAMLSPDARRYLTRTGRSPDWAFGNAAEMAKSMRKFSAEFKAADTQKALPTMKSFRLSLAVASADNMPLVVAVSDDPSQRKALDARLAEIAWSKELLGQYEYSHASTPADIAAAKIQVKPGLYVIAPDVYGQTGEIIARLDDGAIEAGLKTAFAHFKPPVKEAQTHIAEGHQKGIYWKTATPVTDPHAPRGLP